MYCNLRSLRTSRAWAGWAGERRRWMRGQIVGTTLSGQPWEVLVESMPVLCSCPPPLSRAGLQDHSGYRMMRRFVGAEGGDPPADLNAAATPPHPRIPSESVRLATV